MIVSVNYRNFIFCIFFLPLLTSSCSTFVSNNQWNQDLVKQENNSKSGITEIISQKKNDLSFDKSISVQTAVVERNYFKIDISEEEIQNEYVRGSYVAVPYNSDYATNSQTLKTFVINDDNLWGLKNKSFDFPVVHNKATEKWVRYFSTRGRDHLNIYLSRSGRYAPLMARILEENGLPKDLIFLVMAESGFANHAKSRARAVGPWQFMKRTALHYGLKIDWFVDERRDPIKASYAASRYLKDLHENFGSWELAAAAYNAGEGKIARALRKSDGNDFWDISKGKYLKKETRNYVPKIMALAIIGKNLSVFGFEEILFESPLEFEIVKVRPMTDLYRVAEASGVDFSDLKRWNPELIKSMTPPDVEYALRFPPGAGEKFRAHYYQNESFFASKDMNIKKSARFNI